MAGHLPEQQLGVRHCQPGLQSQPLQGALDLLWTPAIIIPNADHSKYTREMQARSEGALPVIAARSIEKMSRYMADAIAQPAHILLLATLLMLSQMMT